MKSFLDKRFWLTIIIAGISTCIVLGFSGFLPGEKYSLLTGDDLYMQCVSFCVGMTRKIHEGSYLFYSSKLGLGGNLALLIAFYVMSPFNFLYLFIRDMTIATLIILILKAMSAAGCFYLFCKHNLKICNIFTILFSIAYSVGSFYFYVFQMNVLYDAVFYLPLLLVLVKLYVEKDNPVPLIFGYIIMFLSNFYCAFIVGIVSFVYFIFLLVSKKERIKYFIHYIFICIISISVAAVTLLPALYVICSSAKTVPEFSVNSPGILEAFSMLLPGVIGELGVTLPHVYCGILPLILCGGFIIDKRNKTTERLFTFFAITFFFLSIYVPFIYIFLHMFNKPDGYTVRYSYLLSFIICATAVKESVYFTINKSKIIRAIQMVLFVGLICELIYNGCCMTKTYIYLEEDYFRYSYNEARGTVDYLRENDNTVYRIQMFNNMSMNAPFLLDYWGITGYSSADSNNYREILGKLGYGNTEFLLREYGTTDIMKMLLGEKYTVGLSSIYDKSSGYINQNKYNLALGYLVDSNVKNVTLSSDSPFDNINGLVYGMTGVEDFFTYSDMFNISLENANAYFDDNTNLVVSKNAESAIQYGEAKFLVEKKDGMQAYAYLSNIYVNKMTADTPFLISNNDPVNYFGGYSRTGDSHIMLMDDEDDCNSISVIFDDTTVDSVSFMDAYFTYSNEEKSQEVYEKLMDGQMMVTDYNDGYLRGNVSVGSGESDYNTLFISIPYEKGWRAYVDGQEHEIVPLVDDGFIGLELTSGEHEIELRFEAPFSHAGLVLALIGSICVMVEVIIHRKKSKNNK